MSREPRGTPITVYIEASIWMLAQSALLAEDITASSYIRNLIITDLRARRILTEELLVGLLTGKTLDTIQEALAAVGNAGAGAGVGVTN